MLGTSPMTAMVRLAAVTMLGLLCLPWWSSPGLAAAAHHDDDDDAAATADEAQLVEAARGEDAAAVQRLLDQGSDVNESQGDGATALHWAAYRSDAETAEALIRGGANVNALDDLGVTPLDLACENADAEMVTELLNAGADPNVAASLRPSALMFCARTGSVRAVRQLLERGADVDEAEPSRGQTPLMWAVAQDHVGVVRELLDHGADLQARTRVGSRFVNIADPNDVQTSIVGTMPDGGSTPLLFAARQGALASARLLIDAGANVNDAAADGTSALVMAAHSGHSRLAQFLIEAGADLTNAAAGYTALHAAVLRGDRELVDRLAAHGADLNATVVRGTPVTRGGNDFMLPHNLVGATPFLLAAKFLEVDLSRTLFEGGANPSMALADGTTSLMLAAGLHSQPGLFDRRGRIVVPRPATEERARELVRFLVAQGAPVDAVNDHGDTALHAAAIHGYGSVLRILVDQGAGLDVTNADGQAPLDVAADASTSELLRGLGARPGVRD